MAYAQWVVIKIHAIGTTLSIKNAEHPWGKFYEEGNKDKEIPLEKINKITIEGGNSVVISACGREDSPSGTGGKFDIYDGKTKVGNYYWDCPWGLKINTSTWRPNDTHNYVTQVTGANLDSGALGNIDIKCVKV